MQFGGLVAQLAHALTESMDRRPCGDAKFDRDLLSHATCHSLHRFQPCLPPPFPVLSRRAQCHSTIKKDYLFQMPVISELLLYLFLVNCVVVFRFFGVNVNGDVVV